MMAHTSKWRFYMDIIIDNEVRSEVNQKVGYEFIRLGDIGHTLYLETLGGDLKVGIEGGMHGRMMTVKTLDTEGNIVWHRSYNGRQWPMPHPFDSEIEWGGKTPDAPTPFRYQLTRVQAEKARQLIESLLPQLKIKDPIMPSMPEPCDMILMGAGKMMM